MTVIINGTTGIDTVQDGIVTDAKLNLTANSQEIKDAINAGGDAPIYACRAWVDFNGTGTVAIRASGNVSSITDNGTGLYTLNFTSALPDANYAVAGTTTNFTTTNWQAGTVGIEGSLSGGANVKTTTTLKVVTSLGNNTSPFDANQVNVSIFR